MSSEGTLVYRPLLPGNAALRTLVWVDRQGREEVVAINPRNYSHPRLAPDGTRVALHYTDDRQNVDVWVWDFARSVWTHVTSDPTYVAEALWTPEGQRLIFASWRTGQIAPFWQPSNGAGTAEQIATLSGQNNIAPTRSADGRYLVIRASTGGSSYLALLDFADSLRGPRPVSRRVESTPLLQTEFEEYNADLSPDGRWIAYSSNESGAFDVHLRPFPEVTRGQWTVSHGGGTEPLWSRDGRELFYRSPDRGVMRVAVTPGADWTAGTPTSLFAGAAYWLAPVGNAAVARTYDVSPDGKRFLMLKNVEPDTPARRAPQIVVVQNWHEELKRLVPTK